MKPFTAEEGATILLALAQQIDRFENQIDRASAWLWTDPGKQVEHISYWIRERIQAGCAQAKAREVFWS